MVRMGRGAVGEKGSGNLRHWIDGCGLTLDRWPWPNFALLVAAGHVMVVAKRKCGRYCELPAGEAADLWLTARHIGQVLAPTIARGAVQYVIQDGAQAGQTVAHVHIHVMPRAPGDFERAEAAAGSRSRRSVRFAHPLSFPPYFIR